MTSVNRFNFDTGGAACVSCYFLAAAGPVGWGLSLSCVTREQIDTKHTLGQYLCKHAVGRHNSPEHDRKLGASEAAAPSSVLGECGETNI